MPVFMPIPEGAKEQYGTFQQAVADAMSKLWQGSEMTQKPFGQFAAGMMGYPQDMNQAIMSGLNSQLMPAEIFFHQTTPEAQANIIREGFRLMNPKRAAMDYEVPRGIFLKENPEPMNIGGFKETWPVIKTDVDLSQHKILDIGNKNNILNELTSNSRIKANKMMDVLRGLDKEESAKLDFLDKFLDLRTQHGLNLPVDMINQSTSTTNELQKSVIDALQKLFAEDFTKQGYKGITFHDPIPTQFGYHSGKTMKTTVILDPNIIKVME